MITKYVNGLPPTQAVIITLFYLQDHSVEEVSKILGLSKSNVKIQLFRARKTLASLLPDHLKSV